MSLIKSALELAMERTEGLQVDKDELRRKELFNQGRVAAAKGLEDGPDTFDAAVAAQKTALDKPEYAHFASGAADNLLSRILLAADLASTSTLNKVAELIDRLTGRQAGEQLKQIAGLLQQYGTEVGQLKNAISQQLGPQLKQRAQQSGANPANYVLEKDPNYLKVLAENLEPLRAEYQQALDQLKTDVRGLL